MQKQESSSGGGDASSRSIKRLQKELLSVQGNEHFEVAPVEDDFYQWRFVIHNLPASCAYHGGVYQGIIYFPTEYPLKAPSLIMLTPNGRFKTNMSLCLSATEFHPESWSPSWGCETLLKGFLSFWLDENNPDTFGAVKMTTEERQKLAQLSMDFNKKDEIFCDMFPMFLSDDRASSAAETLQTDVDAGESLNAEVNSETKGNVESKFVESTPETEGTTKSTTKKSLSSPVNEKKDAVTIETEESGPECMICRDESKPEPLIRPCKCTGTMGMVHASCVEEWIATRRQYGSPEVERWNSNFIKTLFRAPI